MKYVYRFGGMPNLLSGQAVFRTRGAQLQQVICRAADEVTKNGCHDNNYQRILNVPTATLSCSRLHVGY